MDEKREITIRSLIDTVSKEELGEILLTIALLRQGNTALLVEKSSDLSSKAVLLMITVMLEMMTNAEDFRKTKERK